MSLPRQVVTRTLVPGFQEFVECFVKQSQPLLVRNVFQQWCPQWTVDELRQRISHDKEQEEGRILIPSPVGANYVARCEPDPSVVPNLERYEQQQQQQQQPPSNNDKEHDGQLLIPAPGVNYVSQYKSQELELPTTKALDQFIQMSRTQHQGCQCRLDPAVFWRPTDELPPLLRDPAFETIYDNSFVWITSPSLRTSLHPDPDEGIMAHLAGHKRALLLSPWNRTKDELDDLFQYRWQSGSLDDLFFHESARGFGLADKYLVDLYPGDMLYIPKSWLHDIESTNETVSLVVRFEIAASE